MCEGEGELLVQRASKRVCYCVGCNGVRLARATIRDIVRLGEKVLEKWYILYVILTKCIIMIVCLTQFGQKWTV